MNSYFNTLCTKGKDKVKDKSIIICGCIRDSAKELKTNIPTIEHICSFFNDYRIIVVENNSRDNTKEVLKQWSQHNNRVIPLMFDFDESKYNGHMTPDGYDPAFSYSRIARFVDYRNIYMDYIANNLDMVPNYMTVMDFDLSKIDADGFMTSFGVDFDWDAVTANGYSYSPSLRRRYHDTYPLFECGMPFVDSLEKIDSYRWVFESFRKGMPFVRVASAYNGIAIFKASVRKDLRYEMIFNNNGGVEVLCEHVSIFKQMIEQGHDRIYINPNMELYYQKISWKLILKVLTRWWHNRKID